MPATEKDNKHTSQANNESTRETVRQAADAGRQAVNEASSTARVVAEKAAEVGQHATHASAEIARSATETAQQVNESSVNMATETVRRSITGLAQTLGLAGDRAKESAEEAKRNVKAITDSTTVLARGFQDISREWVNGAQDRFRKNLDGVGRLTRCRTPQDFLAVQSDMIRDYLEGLLDSSRRVSELSIGITRDAADKITAQAEESAEQVRRVA